MAKETTKVSRFDALNWLQRWKDRDVIKVITGIRRCGKSTVLRMAQDAFIQAGTPKDSIVFLDLERMGFSAPTTPKDLYDLVVSSIKSDKSYIFIDEPQRIEGFEQVVDALYAREDCDVYITGSNSKLLSSELGTLLTGRYVEYQLLPLSFAEYNSAFLDRVNTDTLFNQFISLGSMPYVTALPVEDVSEYLDAVLNTILVKDVAMRHPRINMVVMRALLAFLADNIGNRFSLKTIANTLTNEGIKISPTTVGEYLSALPECYLIFKAEPYDAKGRTILQQGGKYYLGDLGFRHLLLGRDSGDLGHRIENAVYLELLRRYRTVRVGRVGEREIDFIADDKGKPHYFQVSLSVLDEKTLRRELKPLELIEDAYPKTLLTLDRVGVEDHNGINQLNLIDWLLE